LCGCRNINLTHRFSGVLRLKFLKNLFKNIFASNTKNKSKKYISKHYDLGNEFFSIWLDETLTYSSAIYDKPTDNLSNAQINKYNKLIKFLKPKAGDKVLEVGCGWGGFAEHLTKNHDVKLDCITISKKQLDIPDYPNNIIYPYLRQKGFDNPKKVYATFTGFKSKHGNSDGGEGFVPMMVIYTPAVKTYGQPDMDLVILHELFHTQAAAYGCGKRTYKGSHVKGSDILGVNTVTSSVDSRNDTYYKHDIEGCPDLAKSVFVTPTAKDSWDPYDVFCRKKRGNLTHPDLYTGSHRCKGGAN
jgi:hypothetical protein